MSTPSEYERLAKAELELAKLRAKLDVLPSRIKWAFKTYEGDKLLEVVLEMVSEDKGK